MSRAQLLRLWFEAGPAKWWHADAAFDASLAPFLPLMASLVAGAPPPPEPELSPDEAALAEVLACDQIPRNCFRKRPEAFAADATALRLARAAVAAGALTRLADEPQRLFMVMPYMHSEEPAAHVEAAAAGLWPAANAAYASEHAHVVATFGRFPHRNAVLGRESTEAEAAHLASAERKGWESL